MKSKTPWVIVGGAMGEFAHCERCGEGLRIGTQRIEIALAAWRAFIKIHARCRDVGRVDPTPTLRGWPTSRDTGISSATIYYVFTATAICGDRFDIPHDPADFGRCYRLLKLGLPEWTLHLGRVAERFPEWTGFVREWPRLTAMYERVLAAKGVEGDKISGELYDLMKELEVEGRRGGG